jgi:D-alanine-D-alanine ligase-like ATP-grasp enzyme
MRIEYYKVPAGYIRGQSQPAIVLTISFPKNDTKIILSKLRVLSSLMPKKRNFFQSLRSNMNTRIIEEFSELLYNYYSYYDYPVTGHPTIFSLRPTKDNTVFFNCICYSHTPSGFYTLGTWICNLLKMEASALVKEFWKNSENILKNIDTINNVSRMNREFLRAGTKFEMPIKRVYQNVFQFGWGKNGFQLNGTFLEQIPWNATLLARSKIRSRQMLQSGGFPVPNELKVSDEESCRKFVAKFGFPVVVKPSDKDGGLGVRGNIFNDEELLQGFSYARKQSRNIIIQNHIRGKDYRLTIVKGKLVWCHERHPASVSGDGVSTIKLLIKKENNTPKRDRTRATALQKINQTELLENNLRRQGLSLKSILKNKQTVHLSSTCSISAGGVPVVVPKNVIHPDNVLLAERAAKLFRLDITGVDLIIPDIQKSWMEVGGKIIEMNAMPDLSHTSPHIYEMILKDFVSGDGRGASAVIFSKNFNKNMLAGFIKFCETNDRKLGMIVGDDILINNTIIAKASGNPVEDCQVLYFDKTVDYIVIITDINEKFWINGLGLAEFDFVCFEQEFERAYDQRFTILAKTVSGEICASERLEKPIKIGGLKITKTYKSLNEYLIINMPHFDEIHRQKFKSVKFP